MGYHYTAIGDSLTTGVGALPGNGFVPVYRRMAEGRLDASITSANLGVNGMTTAELEAQLRRSSAFRQSIQAANLVTLSIGGNDLIRAARSTARSGSGNAAGALQRALRECKGNFSGIMSSLYRLKAGARSPYIIRIVGLYNPYPQIAEATAWVTQFNRYAAGYSNRVCRFASVYEDFAGNERQMLSIDRLHPNGRGYRAIAGRLDALGYGGLR